ncbi:MAG: lipoyl(octanoyl) transferase LipB [Candidatus Hydrogenedens sp.]|jgi:lipoate-protein ligase B|nr:lipoyl(octanoyl) transferase LipB [Candidatus Hydrogenedens sp.]
MIPIHFISLEKPVAYDHMCKRQEAVCAALQQGQGESTVFLLEHEAVITQGRRTRDEHILASRERLKELGISLAKSDRGGDVTYHGQGQLVVYPILNLNDWRPSVDWYLRQLEEVIIRLLARYGLKGQRSDGFTGVWVGEEKIAAVGISIRHWITWHGIALNVDPVAEHWQTIIPCGIRDRGITSLAQLLDNPPSLEEVKEEMIRSFQEVFPCEGHITKE